MIEGLAESVDAAGMFHGWLRDTESHAPVHIQIRRDGAVIAEALASRFRPDLLRSGHGHGHYGFAARSRIALPPGPGLFELFLPARAQGIPVRLTVPAIADAAPLKVEDLLAPEPAWSAADLRGRAACLDLGPQRSAMPAARLVDLLFQFILERWPHEAEGDVYVRALQDGSLSAEGLAEELLASTERADLGPHLASPWSTAFPFRPAGAKERA